jgi:selenocysteine lyase/cysteine desulfurase
MLTASAPLMVRRRMQRPGAEAPLLTELRAREFSRLDASRQAYLDYAGAALYPASLVAGDAARLLRDVLGNPHSASAPSAASTSAIDEARRMTLRFLDADAETYDVVFTANATAGMRILAEAFPFRRGSRLVLTADNHNSVNGLRLAARRRGAAVGYVPLGADLRASEPDDFLMRPRAASLFAYPAQSNFSGVRHPPGWVREAQRRGYRVLLDAAAFVGAAPLSLRSVPADFVALSFYKMFGYPTGVGALVVRHDALRELRRRYFAGGTVEFVSVQNALARMRPGAEGFEDGTPHFLAMSAVTNGLRWLRGVGMAAIDRHDQCLTRLLLDRLAALGDRVVVYGPRGTHSRGGIVSFNVRRDGRIVPFEVVEEAARRRGVAIRGGCFCNPGAAEHAFGVPPRVARQCLREEEFSIARLRACLDGIAVGALRASVGPATTITDVERLTTLVEEMTRR